ncbi:MAG: SRPBCC family protein [Deltaproteobacteria bacterium]|nr:SRPBCC family protein [Deltaproteobacteria bacterium]
MIIRVVASVLVIVGVFLAYAALKSGDYVISRELAIHAPAEKVFPYLNNSKLAGEWMPWAEADPTVKMSYSGPAEGVGSRSSWDSPGQMGTGSATVVESVPNRSVHTKLEYVKPFQMQQDAELSIRPADAGNVIVTWSVKGTNTFMGRVMCSFMNMDKMVGGSFEKGLSNLKTRMEKI